MKKCGIEPYQRAELSEKKYFGEIEDSKIYESVSSKQMQVLISVLTLIVAVISLVKK